MYSQVVVKMCVHGCDRYLFAGYCNSSIWIPDLMTLIQYNVVPVEALQGVLQIPHS